MGREDKRTATRRHAEDVIAMLTARIAVLEASDRGAATHVESVLALRTAFTGELPYVGWEGLGLALREALDERDDYKKALHELKSLLAPRTEENASPEARCAHKLVAEILAKHAKGAA